MTLPARADRFQALMERVRGRSVTFSLCDNSHVTLQFSPHLRPVYVLGCELVSTAREQGLIRIRGM